MSATTCCYTISDTCCAILGSRVSLFTISVSLRLPLLHMLLLLLAAVLTLRSMVA